MYVENTTPQRLDKVLTEHLGMSRNQIEKLIESSLVSVNGTPVTKTSHKVVMGDTIEYTFKEALKKEAVCVDFDVPILYEDEDILVINKPPHLVVHSAPSVKEATLVDWLIARGISLSTISGEERHGIVHRIDKETTGALVVAKNNEAHQKLSAQLADKSMGRYYLALIDHPLKEDITIDKPIARSPKNRLKMDIVAGGREARTSFVNLCEGEGNLSLIAAKLFTGRTHQIRVHLATVGRHILGDTLYGYRGKHKGIERVNLHAYLLYLIHPRTGKKMEFVAPLYGDMEVTLHTYFNQHDITDIIEPTKMPHYFTSSNTKER